jgi:DNA polymerase III subunit delta'
MSIPLDLLRERMIGGITGDGHHHESAVFRTAGMGNGKVFIVDEAELLQAEAQNAMLKTLEEPPARTVIVLVTQQEEQLLPTIRSRCQRVSFGPLDADAMRAWWERGGPEVAPADRAFVDAFAAGSPGMAVLAAQHGIAAWDRELGPHFAAVESGRFPPGLAERLAEIADGFAKSIVDEDENASKDAANRLAVRLLAQLAGMRVRRGLAAAGEDPAELARWLGASEALGEFERMVRSNANLKLAFANLVAQWAERTAPRAGAGAANAR